MNDSSEQPAPGADAAEPVEQAPAPAPERPADRPPSGRTPRAGPTRTPGRRPDPRAGHGRGAEDRQRPPGHRDEPGAGRVHAVPADHAARPGRPELAGPGPVRAVRRPLQPHPLHPALPVRVRAGARRPQGAADLGLADPGPPRARAHRRGGDHHRAARPGRRQRGRLRDGRPARARPARPRRRRPARASSTTGSSRSARTATWRRASPARRPRWPATRSSATSR